MPPTTTHIAIVCSACRRSALVERDSEPACSRCGAETLMVPGAEYTALEVPLFTALEGCVNEAELSIADAARIAAELDAVGNRWEPPELALERLGRRLPGLTSVCSPEQTYPQLLLGVSMLMMIVCARLQAPQRVSGVRPSAASAQSEHARTGAAAQRKSS